jgi:hypothetical protein
VTQIAIDAMQVRLVVLGEASGTYNYLAIAESIELIIYELLLTYKLSES